MAGIATKLVTIAVSNARIKYIDEKAMLVPVNPLLHYETIGVLSAKVIIY
jgi:hypothetical protein